MSKFFNRNWKAGFTLVELIVVIAILAILAGIAIPVYSGYIAKANLASDYVLLDAANQALAAASLEHGVDASKLVVTLDVNDSDHTIDGIESVSGSLDGFVASPIRTERNGYILAPLSSHHTAALAVTPEQAKDALDESFMKYFGDNTNVPLKELWKQTLILSNGAVLSLGEVTGDGETATLTVSRNGKTATFTVTKEQAEALKNSTFGGDNMTMGELMGDIGGMVDSLTDVLNSGATVASILSSMGMDLEAMGIKEPYDNYKSELSNAVVLAVASQVQSGFETQIAGLMADKDSLTQLTTMMKTANVGTMVNQLGSITSFYAMATGFANSDDAAGWSITIGEGDAAKTYDAKGYYNYINAQIAAAAADPTLDTNQKAAKIMSEMSNLSNLMKDAESGNWTTQYNSYITAAEGSTSQMQNDAVGFVQAMAAVSANQDALITSGAVSDGFNGGGIEAILAMIYGYDFSQGN